MARAFGTLDNAPPPDPVTRNLTMALRVQHFYPLRQSKFIPSDSLGIVRETVSAPSLASIVYPGALSEERHFEIIGHLQRMVHDTHEFYSKSLTKYDTSATILKS